MRQNVYQVLIPAVCLVEIPATDRETALYIARRIADSYQEESIGALGPVVDTLVHEESGEDGPDYVARVFTDVDRPVVVNVLLGEDEAVPPPLAYPAPHELLKALEALADCCRGEIWAEGSQDACNRADLLIRRSRGLA